MSYCFLFSNIAVVDAKSFRKMFKLRYKNYFIVFRALLSRRTRKLSFGHPIEQFPEVKQIDLCILTKTRFFSCTSDTCTMY